MILAGAARVVVPEGNLVLGSTAVTSTAAELNLLDGVSGLVQADLTKLAAVDSTAAELNIVDGGTSATSTTVADADRVVMNDNGTMVQVAVTDLAAYFDDEITAMPNLVTTAATTVGALASGSIAAGFGAIDNGTSGITTGGNIIIDVDADADDNTADSSTGRLTIGAGGDLNLYHGGTHSYIVNSVGSLYIHSETDDSDIVFTGEDGSSGITALTLDMSAAGAATFNDKIIATELDISGNVDIDGTTNLDAVDIDGAVQLDATLTVGANDQGYDVILYGDTASANVTWDTSADDLILNGAAGLIVPEGKLTLGSTAVTSTAAELNKLDGVGTLAQAGKQSIWIPAAAITPTKSNGCAARTQVETQAGRPDMDVLDFDNGSDEHAQFSIAFPKSWNLGTVTFSVYWTSTATDTDGCAWGLQGVSVPVDASIDRAYGTAVVVTDVNGGAAEDCMVTAESAAVTIAGGPDDTELMYFRIFRDVSDAADDMAEDARLIGLKLFYTTDAANDA